MNEWQPFCYCHEPMKMGLVHDFEFNSLFESDLRSAGSFIACLQNSSRRLKHHDHNNTVKSQIQVAFASCFMICTGSSLLAQLLPFIMTKHECFKFSDEGRARNLKRPQASFCGTGDIVPISRRTAFRSCSNFAPTFYFWSRI